MSDAEFFQLISKPVQTDYTHMHQRIVVRITYESQELSNTQQCGFICHENLFNFKSQVYSGTDLGVHK